MLTQLRSLSVHLVDDWEVIFTPYPGCPGPLFLAEICSPTEVGGQDYPQYSYSLETRQVNLFLKPSHYWKPKPVRSDLSKFVCTAVDYCGEDLGGKCTVWVNVLNPVLQTRVSASFRDEAVIFYPGSFVLAPNPALSSPFPLKLVLFFSSQETCLLVTWMISSRKTAKGPALP